MGAQLVREVATKTSDLTGDGTTTATLLAQSMLREGMRVLADGVNPMLLRRGIEEAVELVVADLLRDARVQVDGRDDAAHVATIAAKEDERIGGAVAEALRPRRRGRRRQRRGGRRCPGVGVDFVEGLHVENGYMSPYMVRDRMRMETVLREPLRPDDRRSRSPPSRSSWARSAQVMRRPGR